MSKKTELVRTYLDNKDIVALKKLINELDIIEILTIIDALSPEDSVLVFRLLNKDLSIEVFEELDTGLQQRLFASFTEDRVIELINELPPDDRVKLFDEMPAKVTQKLLAKLSPEERESTALLMGYEQETAGRIMTTEYVSLKKHLTIKQALKRIRDEAEEKETIYTIYVTNDSRVLEGVTSLRDIIIADENDTIESIMSTGVVSVTTDTNQEDVARKLYDLGLLAIPVVDKENRLVGIITVDDAMEIIEEETTEDVFQKSGLASYKDESGKSETLVKGSIFSIWKVRLPFLLITLAGSLLAGSVIHAFENTLAALASAAIFMPIIMDMGGNTGTQSSTIFTRAFVLGHIKPNEFWKALRKELLVGLSMGLIVGTIAGVISFIWQGMLGLSLAVACSLVITMTIATGLGFGIPYLLNKLGLDQAAGADPIIITIKAITGLSIYFLFVNLFMSAWL
ncbi:MAG: magnesium transporter [Bacillota bacterium]|jgi:magnesium transporter|nr:magnesium transporter [Bacillota bacterium]HHU43785.1 magnesium transporter [Clostridiales bacterium]